MKYREEVFSKIFTYITVIILLGIIAFEAYMLQTERNKIADMEQSYQQAKEDLRVVRELNYDLRAENTELEKFQNEWIEYAAFKDTVKTERFQKDIFSRPELIPEDAINDWRTRELEELIAARDEEELIQNEGDEDEQETSELTIKDVEMPEFVYENPNGNSVFIPFGHSQDPNGAYLFYTVAFLKDSEEGESIRLLFELPLFKGLDAPMYDNNRKLIWNCLAYNIGDGWEVPEIDEENKSEGVED